MPLLETRGSSSALAYGLNSFLLSDITDIYASSTVFLLKNTGVSSATNNTFLDSAPTPNTITRNGNVCYGSVSPFLNETSRYFNGSNTYFSIPDSDTFNFGSGDFTVEFWAKTSTSLGSTSNPVFNQSNSGASSDSSIFVGFGTDASVYVSSGSGWTYNATSSGVICNDNEWHHLAAVRTGTSLRIYIDGALRGSTTLAGGFTLGNSTRLVEIGYQTSGSYYTGSVSNLRVVKGTAVYTSNFIPPQQKLTAISGTSLLTLIKARNIDESLNAHKIAAFGTHQTTVFYPPIRKENKYSSSSEGGSIYFDGVDDYLTMPHSSAFNFGTGNFTIEYWARFDTLTPNGSADFQTTFTKNYTNGILLQTTNATGRLQVYLASGTPVVTEPSNPEVGTWIHYAVVRNGTTVTLYKNGISVSTGTSSSNVSSSNAVGIGANINDGSGQANGTYPFKGNLSNYRVSNNARYTSNFNPHSSPLSSDANTVLLLKAENASVYDITGNSVIDTIGSTVNTTYKKFTSESSVSLGNSTTRLESPNNQDYNFGNRDFTLDGWVYPVSNNVSGSTWWPIMVMGKGGGDQGSSWWWGIYYDQPTNAYHMQVWLSTNGTTWVTPLEANLPGGAPISTTAASPLAINFNQWNHFAVAREKNVIRLFHNGNLIRSQFFDWTLHNSNRKLQCGWDQGSIGGWTAYATDYRITKDVARYTNSFTVPAEPAGIKGTSKSYLQSIKSLYDQNNSGVSTGSKYFILPDQTEEVEVFALKQVSDICSIPGGTSSWVTNARAMEIVSRSTLNNRDTQTVSYRDFLKIVKSKWDLTGSGYSPYFYWFIVDNGVLWGATRTRFNNTFDQWRVGHTGDSSAATNPIPSNINAYWDVWHSTYTKTNWGPSSNPSVTPRGIVRMVPYSQNSSIVGGIFEPTSYGLHYKRQDNGEHYPWRDVERINIAGGYFAPSGGLDPSGGGVTQSVPATAIHYIGVGI